MKGRGWSRVKARIKKVGRKVNRNKKKSIDNLEIKGNNKGGRTKKLA